MSRQKLVLDSLWYTLRPSFCALETSRPIFSKSTRKNRIPCLFPNIATAKCYSSNTDETGKGITDHLQPTNSPEPPVRYPNESSGNEHHEQDPDDLSGHELNTPEETLIFGTKNKIPVHYNNELHLKYSISDLEKLLRKYRGMTRTHQILRTLAKHYHIKPNANHYKALLDANRDIQFGSPNYVRQILKEMEKENVPVDSGLLHIIIMVLAVHPDYLLRQEILVQLRERWFTLSPDGWHYVVAGLIREHQFELALDQMALMERKLIPVQNWLHSMMIYNMCDFEEFDEVNRLVQARVEQGHKMTKELWLHVLSTASKALHYDMTVYIWQRMIYLDYLQPSESACKDSLATASHAGDTELAQKIFDYAGNMKFKVDASWYEHLIEVHLNDANLQRAMELMSQMHKAEYRPTDRSVEMIITHMIEAKTDPREVWHILKEMKMFGSEIPIESVLVVIGFCERSVKENPSISSDAAEFHKELHSLCADGGDVRVYNALMQVCRGAGDREAAMFILKDMVSHSVKPDSMTFETVILMCLEARNYKSAYMYFEDLLKRNGSVSQKTREEIRKLCAESVHEFAMQLQYHPGVRDDEIQFDPSDSLTEETEEMEESSMETHSFDLVEDREWLPAAVHRKRLSNAKRIEWNKRRRQRKRVGMAIERRKANEADEGTDSS